MPARHGDRHGRRRQDAARIGARRRGRRPCHRRRRALPSLRRRDHVLAADGAHPRGSAASKPWRTRWTTSPTRRSSSSDSARSAAADPPRRRSSSGPCGDCSRRSPSAAARRAPRGRPLGRADAARSRRARQPLEPRRADPPALRRAAGAARGAARGGRARSCVSSRSRPGRRPSSSTRSTIAGILSPELRGRVAETAQGNPLYTEQLVAMLAEEARAAAELVDAAADDPGAPRRPARPPRSRRAERARAGRRRRQGVLARRGELPSASGDEALGATLLDARRAVSSSSPPCSSFPGEDGFRFRHALIRDAAYAGIPKRTRADLHERFAGWLELHGGRDELLGYHLEQAYRYRDELGCARRPHALARCAGRRAAHGRRATRTGSRRRAGGGQPARTRGCAVAPDG